MRYYTNIRYRTWADIESCDSWRSPECVIGTKSTSRSCDFIPVFRRSTDILTSKKEILSAKKRLLYTLHTIPQAMKISYFDSSNEKDMYIPYVFEEGG